MKKIIVLILIFSTFIFASKKVPVERGWRFGEFNKKEENKTKIDLAKVLLEILKLQREQLKVQKEILAKVKSIDKRVNPKPIIITKPDGTKCVANSSADCFLMPLAKDALRIPVLAKYLQNPTKENAKEWYRWLSEYFRRVSIATQSYLLVTRELNEVTSKYGFDTFSAFNPLINNRFYERMKILNLDILARHSKRFKLIFFFGMTKELEKRRILRHTINFVSVIL